MNIIIVCYPTYGGSGVLATELGHKLAEFGHKIHFVAYKKPVRLTAFPGTYARKFRTRYFRRKRSTNKNCQKTN